MPMISTESGSGFIPQINPTICKTRENRKSDAFFEKKLKKF